MCRVQTAMPEQSRTSISICVRERWVLAELKLAAWGIDATESVDDNCQMYGADHLETMTFVQKIRKNPDFISSSENIRFDWPERSSKFIEKIFTFWPDFA